MGAINVCFALLCFALLCFALLCFARRAKEQKSKRAKEQKSKRAKEQKSKRAKEQKSKMSTFEEIQSILDELVDTPATYTPTYDTDSSLSVAEDILDSIFEKNAITIKKKYNVNFNPKATTAHILDNFSAYSEDDIMSLINTEVDEENTSGHEPLRRACTIQKTLKVINHVFGIPMKKLYFLCGSESFARCQHELEHKQCKQQAVSWVTFDFMLSSSLLIVLYFLYFNKESRVNQIKKVIKNT